MANQFRSTVANNNYSYSKEPSLKHQASIPFETIVQGVNGISPNNYPRNSPRIPQAPNAIEKPQYILKEQQTPIKRIDKAVQIDPRRQNIIQRQPNKLTSGQYLTAPLPPQRRVEYIPYQQRYIEYVEQKVRVPVHKVMTDYYTVQHIIDYVPIEKADVVYVTQPQQVVQMKLQYVPVEQRIIHINQEDAKMYGINQQHANQYYSEQQNRKPLTYQAVAANEAPPYYANIPSQILRKSRTNYVTAQGYDPNQKLQEIDKVLAASAVRQSRVKKAAQQNNSGQQIVTNAVSGVSDMKKKQSIYDLIGAFPEVAKKESETIKNSNVK